MINSLSAIKVVQTLVPILGNNTAEGTGEAVDRWGHLDAVMVAQCGISGDTLSGSIYWTISFQDCATTTAGEFANIAAADLEGGVNDHVINAGAEDPTTIIRGYRGTKRYLRILFTQTGTHTNGTPIAGVVILGRPVRIPVTQVAELGG
jgi:polyisoprenoid-binding protein YceI